MLLNLTNFYIAQFVAILEEGINSYFSYCVTIVQIAPYINPTKIALEVGLTAKINCSSRIPVTWFFRGNVIPQSEQGLERNVLYVKNITGENEGSYLCIGENNFGEVFHAFADLIIRSKLQCYNR